MKSEDSKVEEVYMYLAIELDKTIQFIEHKVKKATEFVSSSYTQGSNTQKSEVQITYPTSFWAQLLGKQNITKTFILNKGRWIHKKSGAKASYSENIDIQMVISTRMLPSKRL